MEREKKKSGRPYDGAAREVIKSCINDGLGYHRSIPRLIEAGFVDDDGNCTIVESHFAYVRRIAAKQMEFRMSIPREMYDWANCNKDEIEAYIMYRMAGNDIPFKIES